MDMQGAIIDLSESGHDGTCRNITGIDLIARERKDQKLCHGYINDVLANPKEELAKAAVCYALPNDNKIYDYYGTPILWPWRRGTYKPCPNNRIKELIKAGALIAAEIDRLLAIQKEEK